MTEQNDTRTTEFSIVAIIPAFNEEASIGKVLDDLSEDLIAECIVVNNASTDRTASVADHHGATVLLEQEKGYGAACLKGISYVLEHYDTKRGTIILFLDGDHSDFGEQAFRIVEPIIMGDADMVIGSRTLGNAERGSLTIQQRFGNWLAVTLIRWLFGFRYTDLGPFRAIRVDALRSLNMRDRNYGWTVEMQIKAVTQGMKILEVPVDYRVRIGESKVSGTINGTIMAGYKILKTIFQYGWTDRTKGLKK